MRCWLNMWWESFPIMLQELAAQLFVLIKLGIWLGISFRNMGGGLYTVQLCKVAYQTPEIWGRNLLCAVVQSSLSDTRNMGEDFTVCSCTKQLIRHQKYGGRTLLCAVVQSSLSDTRNMGGGGLYCVQLCKVAYQTPEIWGRTLLCAVVQSSLSDTRNMGGGLYCVQLCKVAYQTPEIWGGGLYCVQLCKVAYQTPEIWGEDFTVCSCAKQLIRHQKYGGRTLLCAVVQSSLSDTRNMGGGLYCVQLCKVAYQTPEIWGGGGLYCVQLCKVAYQTPEIWGEDFTVCSCAKQLIRHQKYGGGLYCVQLCKVAYQTPEIWGEDFTVCSCAKQLIRHQKYGGGLYCVQLLCAVVQSSLSDTRNMGGGLYCVQLCKVAYQTPEIWGEDFTVCSCAKQLIRHQKYGGRTLLCAVVQSSLSDTRNMGGGLYCVQLCKVAYQTPEIWGEDFTLCSCAKQLIRHQKYGGGLYCVQLCKVAYQTRGTSILVKLQINFHLLWKILNFSMGRSNSFQIHPLPL